jgi:NAD(P)-dependent dehydrogenase (short-subunit alcohol dehydrogenase family)
MKDVHGKVAFITGGASGIGLGMATVFARNGMQVVVADISESHLADAARQLREHAAHCRFMRLDVTDRAAMERAADEAEKAFGKVHVLCNNAGVISWPSLEQATFADWDWMLSVNLGGVVNGIVTFLPRLLRHGEGGHVVNTASMAALAPLPGPAALYTTSKYAVRGLSESLRLTVGSRGIGVTTLCPGLTRSNIAESEKLRPGASSLKDERTEKKSLANIGMDPLELGEAVLAAIRRNDPYVLAHAENRASVREAFEEVLSSFTTGEVTDPGRLAFMAAMEDRIAAGREAQRRIRDQQFPADPGGLAA